MRRFLGLIPAALVLPLLPALAGAPAGSATGGPVAATQVEVDVPTIAWGPCEFEGPPTVCATVRLPLDYDDPDGPTTPIKLLKVPASGDRIGSLFVNPGGPGGSALGFATAAGDLIGPGVSRRFDVIGVEPRGIGENPAAKCFLEPGERLDYPRTQYPLTDHQEWKWLRGDRMTNRACRAGRSPITDHMSTADYARDIDVVRQAEGDEQLSFYGISYGSMVGQTYAAMFPDRVRAMIVDGVLDPVAWTTGRDPEVPSTYQLRSGEGAYEALTTALNDCDRVGRERCPLSGHATESWLRVIRLARRGKLRADGMRITEQDVVGSALGSLYSASDIMYLIRFIKDVERSSTRGTTTTRARVAESWRELERIRAERDRIGPYGVAPGYGARWVGFESVLCADAVNPADQQAWPDAARRARRAQPWFGPLWTWASSLCAGWPARSDEDAFRGPWRTTTATPLLVVGNTHDPATPINGARVANRKFVDSVLLTLNGWGHGALDSGPCIRTKMADYLIEQRLPRPSTWCRPARPLFP